MHGRRASDAAHSDANLLAFGSLENKNTSSLCRQCSYSDRGLSWHLSGPVSQFSPGSPQFVPSDEWLHPR